MTVGQIASDEINFLVYRYLQESGFAHSSFVFGMESNISHSNIKSSLVPPAALCTLLIKGLCYIQAEILIQEDGSVMQYLANESLSLIDAVTPDMVLQRRKAIIERIEEEKRQKELAKKKQQQEALDNKEKLEKEAKDRENKQKKVNTVEVKSNSASNLTNQPMPPKKLAANLAKKSDENLARENQTQQNSEVRSLPQTNSSTTIDIMGTPVSSPGLPEPPVISKQNKPTEKKKNYTLEPDDSMSQGSQCASQCDNESIADKNENDENESVNGIEVISPAISENGDMGSQVSSTPSSYVKIQGKKKMRAISPDNPLRVSGSSAGLLTLPTKNSSSISTAKNSPIGNNVENNKNISHIHHHHIHHHYDENGKLIDPKKLGSNPETYNIRSTIIRPNNNEGNNDNKQIQLSAKILRGHEMEVFICAWSPTEDYLVSGSGDSTARIWDLRANGTGRQIVLKHCLGNSSFSTPNSSVEKTELQQNQNLADTNIQSPTSANKDVCAVDWTSDGARLATGSYDGHARIWTSNGDLKQVCGAHNGPVFALKWNKKGDMVVSSGVDKSCVVWDPNTGKSLQKFCFHQQPILDVDWQSNDTFASCSTDKEIHICRMGENQPLKIFKGHTDEVNAIRWDPQGYLLASCSDDHHMKIWTMDGLAHNIEAHEKEIYSVRWSPAGPGSRNPNAKSMLASASFDRTVKVWEPHRGVCMNHLKAHEGSVYSVNFSPDSTLLASGAFDGYCFLWDLRSNNKVGSYKISSGGIYDVSWSMNGHRVAIAASNAQIAVLDVRQMTERLK